ncbi:MAG: TrkA family potassium uptake protein, partial [Streptococcus salivarius]
VLYGMGANWVITPERSTAKELASNILRYNISNVFHLEDDVALIELKIPKEWAGKSLHTLNLRQNYNVNVIGFRDEQNGKLNTHFDPIKKLPDEGIILVVADNRTLEKFDYLGYLK